MRPFSIALGWTFIVAGLAFSAMLIMRGMRQFRMESTHEFSFWDWFCGKNRRFRNRPAIELFVDAILGILGVVLLYVLLFHPVR